MNFKLTFGVFAVIISTIEAVVIKYDANSLDGNRIYDWKSIGEMTSEMIADIPNKDNTLSTWISPSQLDQWNTAIKGEYTGYKDVISRRVGPNINEPSTLSTVLFHDHLGRQVQIDGTLFRTSDEFPDLTIDADRQSISKRTILVGNHRNHRYDWRLFKRIARLIRGQFVFWDSRNEIPMEYNVTEVARRRFMDDGVETIRIRLNPNEGPVSKFYKPNQVPNWLAEIRERAEETESSFIYDCTITKPGRLTVIERFNLQSLAFPEKNVDIVGISLDARYNAFNLTLEFPQMVISADCYSVTKHDGVIRGSYTIPNITIAFENLIVELTARWEDVDSDHSRITEAEIINIIVDGFTDIRVEFDPRMKWLIDAMWINIDDLVEQRFDEILTRVKQSATAKDYLKTFLESMFYEDNVSTGWANN